jgi:hypothetical protein
MNPTPEQKDQLYRLTYLLTNMYVPINLIRIDDRTGRLIILAGNELEIVVTKQGKVAYEEAELQDDE